MTRCRQQQHIEAEEQLQDFVDRWTLAKSRAECCDLCAAFAADRMAPIRTFDEVHSASEAPMLAVYTFTRGKFALSRYGAIFIPRLTGQGKNKP